jgi:hypothetical protein
MGALELSKEYYFEVADPLLKRDFSDLYPRLDIGLVGNGSDRFGFDDDISTDHDWGVDFYLWVTEEDKESVPALNEWKTALFNESPPKAVKNPSQYCLAVTAMTVGDFYRQLIGSPQRPSTLNDWIKAPEENYALATNGEVWLDGAGEFTQARSRLLDYFPEDLRRKRMAAKCMEIAQTGQYNHMRMAKRGDWVTVRIVLARFSEAAMALAFQLNKVYRPYYKWAYRKLAQLPLLGSSLAAPLERLALSPGFDEASLASQREDVSAICDALIAEIRRQGLSDATDWFMTAQGEDIQRSITHEWLRALPAQHEI